MRITIFRTKPVDFIVLSHTIAVDAATGRVTIGFGGDVGASVGADAKVSVNAKLEDVKAFILDLAGF